MATKLNHYKQEHTQMYHQLLCWSCLFLHVVCQPEDYIYRDTDLVNVPVIIFNAFPHDNVTAFIIFEEARVNRIPYGDYAHEKVLLQANDDFLFEYRKILSEEAVLEFMGYGFIGSAVDRNTEVLIVLSQISTEANAPLGDVVAFDTDFEAGFSKLYIYNAVTTTKTLGLNFYSLYLRRNSDGSESEGIATLATSLDFHSGIDVNVEPNLVTQIKGFYKLITSVDRFKLDTAVVTLDYLEVKPGKRHYLVAYGVDGSSTTPPNMKEVVFTTSVDSSSGSRVMIIFPVILLLLLLQCLCV